MADHLHGPESIEALRAELDAQASRIEQMQRLLEDVPDRPGRREMFKGGLGIGGLVALTAAGAGLAGASSSVSASAPPDVAGELPAYLRLTDVEGILISGDATVAGEKGWIEVIAYEHGIVSPRDSASGQATGKRQHKPLTIRKRIDKSSPLLMRALIQNQRLKTATLRLYRNGKGQEQFFVIKLENAQVSSVQQSMPDTNKSAGEVGSPPLEELSFTYQKIEWTYVDGGITALDDWETPSA